MLHFFLPEEVQILDQFKRKLLQGPRFFNWPILPFSFQTQEVGAFTKPQCEGEPVHFVLWRAGPSHFTTLRSWRILLRLCFAVGVLSHVPRQHRKSQGQNQFTVDTRRIEIALSRSSSFLYLPSIPVFLSGFPCRGNMALCPGGVRKREAPFLMKMRNFRDLDTAFNLW